MEKNQFVGKLVARFIGYSNNRNMWMLGWVESCHEIGDSSHRSTMYTVYWLPDEKTTYGYSYRDISGWHEQYVNSARQHILENL